MSVVFPKHFPDVLLWVEFRAVTRQIVQLHLVARLLREVYDRGALMIRRAINNENQITIGRRPAGHQESTKSRLREIVQLHPIAKTARLRDCTESFDAF